MNSFERFKNRNAKHIDAQSEINTHFIFKGYPSVKITSGNAAFQAAVVNQQEKNKAYIYTPLANKLTIGSIWTAKTLHWMISEEIITIKDVKWNKYTAFLCNIQVDNTWGYFIGPEKTYVNIKNESGASLESLQKPVLILPENILGFSDTIVIKNRPWLVQEWDAISSPGLVYYSLRATTVSKEVAAAHAGEDVYIEHKTTKTDDIPLTPQQETGTESLVYKIANAVDVTISTEEGYFESDKKLTIKRHTATSVTFNIPFGINEVNIQYKEGGQKVTAKYVTE